MANIEVDANGKWLRVLIAGSDDRPLPAELLWVACPSAKGRRRRMDNPGLTAPIGLRITGASPIGHYGINIAFSDGHDRGIYPWSLLVSLSRRPRPEDFIVNDTGDLEHA